MTRALIVMGAGLYLCAVPLLLNGFVSYAPSARSSFLYVHQSALLYLGLALAVGSAAISVAAAIYRHRRTSLNDVTVAIGYNVAALAVLTVGAITYLILSTA